MDNPLHPTDEQFRSSFDGFKAMPSAHLWEQIEAALPTPSTDEAAATFDTQVKGKMQDFAATPPDAVWPRVASQLPFSLLLRQHVRTLVHISIGAAVIILLFWGYEQWQQPSAAPAPIPATDAPVADRQTTTTGQAAAAPSDQPKATAILEATAPQTQPAAIRRKAATPPSLPSSVDAGLLNVAPVLEQPDTTHDALTPIAGLEAQPLQAQTEAAWWQLPQLSTPPLAPVATLEVTSALTGQARDAFDGILQLDRNTGLSPQAGWSVASFVQLNNTWLLHADLLAAAGPAASYAVDFGAAPSIQLNYATAGKWRWSMGLTYSDVGQRYREILDGERMTAIQMRFWQLPLQVHYRLPAMLSHSKAQLWATAGVQWSGTAGASHITARLDGQPIQAPAIAPQLLPDRTWGSHLGLRYERPIGTHVALLAGAQAQVNIQSEAATWLHVGALVGLQYQFR